MTKHESKSSIPKPDEMAQLYEEAAAIGSEPTIEETADMARKMLEPEAGNQYRDPKAENLADKRKMLWTAVEEIDRSKLGIELSAMLAALGDVYALSDTVHLTLSDYVKQELESRNRSPYIVTAPKKERAAFNVLGIGVLQNAFIRVRRNPVTLKRNPDTLDDFSTRYRARIWEDRTDENTLLAAIDYAYDVLKILCDREALLHAGGNIDKRLEIDGEDAKAVDKWLDELKEEYKLQGKIRRPSDANDHVRSLRQRAEQEN